MTAASFSDSVGDFIGGPVGDSIVGPVGDSADDPVGDSVGDPVGDFTLFWRDVSVLALWLVALPLVQTSLESAL